MVLASATGVTAGGAQGRPSDATLNACDIVTVEEIRVAFGRSALPSAPRATSLPGGGSECRIRDAQRGDIRILLEPTDAKDDVALRGSILSEEGAEFERIGGLGRGAYYWDDRLQVFAGTTAMTLWVTRRPSTEPAAKVREALVALARQALPRLGR